MTRSKPLLACLFLSLALATPATAQSGCGGDESAAARDATGSTRKAPTPAAIAACTRIASPAKRLDCYDALTGHSD